jgi:hypothetical protein
VADGDDLGVLGEPRLPLPRLAIAAGRVREAEQATRAHIETESVVPTESVEPAEEA